MSISSSIIGNTAAVALLKSKSLKVKSDIKPALKKAALFLQGEVKSSIAGRRAEPTSVDTGRFLNSVDIVIGNDEAYVFSDVEYAKFLEFGTSKFRGRRHFNNSKDRNKKKIAEVMASAIK